MNVGCYGQSKSTTSLGSPEFIADSFAGGYAVRYGTSYWMSAGMIATRGS